MNIKVGIIKGEGFLPTSRHMLYYHYWLSPVQKGQILAIHGIGEHGRRYQPLARECARQGYSFFIIDLPGHGRSQGARGHIARFSDYLEAIEVYYTFLSKHRNLGIPFVLGHDLGALIAVYLVNSICASFAGLILTAPLFRLQPAYEVHKLKASLLSLCLPRCPYSSRWLRPELLSHDQTVVTDYQEDSLTFTKVSVRWFTEVRKKLQGLNEVAAAITLPCLILQGSADQVSDPQGGRDFFQALNIDDKRLKEFPGMYHEIFNEVEREAVLTELHQWLTEHTNLL